MARNGLDCGLKSSVWSTQGVAGDPERACTPFSSATGEQAAGALGGEEGVPHAHHEHDGGEQQQDLERVVKEEMHCLGGVRRVLQPAQADDEVGKVGDCQLRTVCLFFATLQTC